MRKGSVVVLACLLLAIAPSAVYATAWSPLTYRFTVWEGGRTVNYCTKAGIIDTATNRSETSSWVSTGANCSTATNVPAGYLAAGAEGYRDGAYCGYSGDFYSSAAYSSWWVVYQACANPSGVQTLFTRAHGAGYNDGSRGGQVGYFWFNTDSPSQNY